MLTRRLCWLGVLVSFLVACSPVFKKVYHYTPPTSQRGMACVKECEQTLQSCERVCSPGLGACKANAREEARLAYAAYVNEREAVGLPIKRDMTSFYDARQCPEDKSCQCEHEYQACYRLCGGQVSSSLR